MSGERKLTGIMIQVTMLFMVGMLSAAVVTFLASRYHSEQNVKTQTAEFAAEIKEEVGYSIREYPAWEWLLRYWYTHADSMEIEYDAPMREGTKTWEKTMLMRDRHPDLVLKYTSISEVEALPPDDQKLFAEIVYSWLISRLNEIKKAYRIDYLFCIVTDESYQNQFFLLSAADEGSVRGTEYEQVYPLGVKVSVADNADQQYAMRYARENTGYLAKAGGYMDYYGYLCAIDDQPVLIGMTYNLSGILANINDQTKRNTSYTLLHQLCLSLICLTLIYVFILSPLKEVQQNIRLYKNTKDSARVIKNLSLVHSGNEIGDLAEDVSALAMEIDDYLERIETITAEKERISTELELAARIQENMLPTDFPPFPERKEFDIYASMDPAKEVGGDFYDFFLTDDDHLCIVIADVSGKGIPAALFMMASMLTVHNIALLGEDPAKALELVNGQIVANNREGMFVSVWLGVLELSTGRLIASNAGHEYPMLKKPDGSFEVLHDKHGLVIGALEDQVYQNYEMTLEPGSKLFLYSDGLPEASDSRNELFGLERALEAAREYQDATAEELLQGIRKNVDEFVGEAEQFDDLTMLCLVYNGPVQDGTEET